MKTSLLNICRLIPLLLIAFTFSSCEEVFLDVEVGGSSSEVSYYTDYITSRVWVDEWKDEKGTFYHQELRFYPNGVGTDYMYSEDYLGYKSESSYEFQWDWKNSRCKAIRLKYGPGDYSYMEDIIMGGNSLDCLFDGQDAYFVGK